MTPLILTLIQLGIQFTPTAVRDIANLLHGNPKTATESEAEYMARIGGLIDANTANIEAQNAEIQKP